jgi:glycine/D-amino acid oxidase-like deaminating enzyme
VSDHVVGVISYEAGALWPYRLVTSVWRSLLSRHEKFLSLETGTPVSDITNDGPQDFPFILHTPRGSICTAHVVHATNAFSSQLIPGLRGKMTGLCATMSAHEARPAFPETGGEHSWSFIYAGGFDYMTQRPGTHGDLMLGGGFIQSANNGLDCVANWKDDQVDPLSESHLRGIIPTVFASKNKKDADISSLKKIWSGTICVTGDLLPFVGKVDPKLTGRKVPKPSKTSSITPEAPAEWISAGYMGDGMVWAWLSGVGLALSILGLEDEDIPARPGIPGGFLKSWFPKSLKINYKRIQRCDIKDIADRL